MSLYIPKYTELERKEYINTKINEKMVCPCGGKFLFTKRYQHSETKKHLKYVEAVKTNEEYIDNVLMKNCKKRE